MHAPRDHRRGEVVRAGNDVSDDFGILGIGDRRFEDADDVPERSPMGPLPSRTVLPRTKDLSQEWLPRAIRENDGLPQLGTVVFRSNQTPRTGCRPITSKYLP